MPGYRTATGTILAVQEQRFRLRTPDGRTLLLTLVRDRLVDDLARWRDARTPVEVIFEGQPNLVSGVACSVRPLPGA